MRFNGKKGEAMKKCLYVLCAVFLAGCAATIPRPGKEGRRPTLTYHVDAYQKLPQKYPLRIGVLTARDKRLIKFYRGQDHFFKEELTQSVSDMIYYELSSSGIFKEVIRISAPAPDELTVQDALMLKKQFNVDLIFLSDITHFSMLRDKTNKEIAERDITTTNDFKITIDFGLIGQVVYLENLAIIWADQIKRQNMTFAKKGALRANELADLTHKTMQQACSDIKTLIINTGKRMVIQ